MASTAFTSLIIALSLGHFIHASPISNQDSAPVKARMPRNCQNHKFCHEKHDDYPDKVIEKLLIQTKGQWQEVNNRTKLADRVGNNFINPCYDISSNEPIYQIIDENNEVRYVVQNKKMFNQIIDIELCETPGKLVNPRPSLITELELKDNDFECSQKYIDFKFVVLSHNRTTFEVAKMKNGVPVNCACEHLGRKN